MTLCHVGNPNGTFVIWHRLQTRYCHFTEVAVSLSRKLTQLHSSLVFGSLRRLKKLSHTSQTYSFLSPPLSLPSSIWPSMAAPDASNGTTVRNAFGSVLSFIILILIGVLAFSIRLFSVSFSPSLCIPQIWSHIFLPFHYSCVFWSC